MRCFVRQTAEWWFLAVLRPADPLISASGSRRSSCACVITLEGGALHDVAGEPAGNRTGDALARHLKGLTAKSAHSHPAIGFAEGA